MECKLVTPESSWYLEAVVGLVLEPENKDMLAWRVLVNPPRQKCLPPSSLLCVSLLQEWMFGHLWLNCSFLSFPLIEMSICSVVEPLVTLKWVEAFRLFSRPAFYLFCSSLQFDPLLSLSCVANCSLRYFWGSLFSTQCLHDWAIYVENQYLGANNAHRCHARIICKSWVRVQMSHVSRSEPRTSHCDVGKKIIQTVPTWWGHCKSHKEPSNSSQIFYSSHEKHNTKIHIPYLSAASSMGSFFLCTVNYIALARRSG